MELKFGFAIFSRSAFSYYTAGRAGALPFWGAQERLRQAALSKALDKDPVYHSYATYLPALYGHDETLDAAMTCIFLTTAELFTTGTTLQSDAIRAQYVHALELLRNKFTKYYAGEQVDLNTMAGSIVLLTVFESITGQEIMAWSTHMAGLASLLSKVDPAVLRGLKSTFGALVLLAALGGCVAEALLNNHACFLEQDEWQDLLVDAHVDAVTTMPHFEPTQKFVSVWCQIPGLLADTRAIVIASASGAVIDSGTVLSRTLMLYNQLKTLKPLMPDCLEDRITNDGMWYVFNEHEQHVGNFCNFQVALAIICRIIVSLQGSSLRYELEAYKVAETVVYMHEAVLEYDDSQSTLTDDCEAGPAARIMQLRHAFAVIDTHEKFLQHCLAADGEFHGARNIINHSDFLTFHNRLRGISLF